MSDQQRHDGEDYWAALYRRRWIIFLVAILSAVFSAFFSATITPLYQASTQFYVPQDAIMSSGGGGLRQSLIRAPVLRDQARMYVAVLESRDAAIAVAEQLEDRSVQDVSRAAAFDVSPAAALVVYVRDRDPAVAQRMVELFVDYFRQYHALRLDDSLMVLERPFVSSRPVFPLVVLNTLIGLAGGVLLGIIYGLFLDYLDVRALARKIGRIEREDWLDTVFNEKPGFNEELGRRDQNAT